MELIHKSLSGCCQRICLDSGKNSSKIQFFYIIFVICLRATETEHKYREMLADISS